MNRSKKTDQLALEADLDDTPEEDDTLGLYEATQKSVWRVNPDTTDSDAEDEVEELAVDEDNIVRVGCMLLEKIDILDDYEHTLV